MTLSPCLKHTFQFKRSRKNKWQNSPYMSSESWTNLPCLRVVLPHSVDKVMFTYSYDTILLHFGTCVSMVTPWLLLSNQLASTAIAKPVWMKNKCEEINCNTRHLTVSVWTEWNFTAEKLCCFWMTLLIANSQGSTLLQTLIITDTAYYIFSKIDWLILKTLKIIQKR